MLTLCMDYNQKIAQAIAPFSAYSDEIEPLLHKLQHIPSRKLLSEMIPSILNGHTTSALQSLVPIAVRKEAGIFFTSTELAEKVAMDLAPMLRSGINIMDPACGAGNLLLACAKYLPPGKSFSDTVRLWSNVVIGYDFYPEFIRAARLRLLVLAASMHPNENHDIEHQEEPFRNLKVGNIFSNLPIPKDTCIVVNPPFGYVNAPDDCQWAKGKIQIAGWFIERLLLSSHTGQHLVAILPDVLRSGTRYQKWRKRIAGLCSSLTIEPAGRFDANTDVDVFILHAVASPKQSNSCHWPTVSKQNDNESSQVIANFFDVHVGSVVPHRDPVKGLSYPYIHARTALSGKTLNNIPEEIQTIRTVFPPPFLVVHRTSSPSDKNRCVATIINVRRKVAVENHLIVLLPKDKSLKTCKSLLQMLKSSEINEWFNERIRCRHLTVSTLRELSYSPKQ